MDNGTALLLSKTGAHVEGEPRLRLLLEVEPAHRVFLRNLVDALLFRPVPRVPATSKPAPFWHDVFIDAALPWRSDRKSTRLNSSHRCISYAVFCLKKK